MSQLFCGPTTLNGFFVPGWPAVFLSVGMEELSYLMSVGGDVEGGKK